MSNTHDPLSSLGGRHAEHQEEGEGNWLVSYADMMTLLVGFFVILLSFSTVDQEKFEAAKLSVVKEFGGLYEKPYEEMGKRIQAEITKHGLGSEVLIKVLPDGVEISFMGTVFFQSGSADLKPEGSSILNSIFPVIKNEKAEFDITIEGHTDDNPIIGGLFKDNFELSSIRACRVLDRFLKEGFKKERMTAVGFGDARPVLRNRDEQGNPIPENQSQNRRVVIKLKQKKESSLERNSPDQKLEKRIESGEKKDT